VLEAVLPVVVHRQAGLASRLAAHPVLRVRPGGSLTAVEGVAPERRSLAHDLPLTLADNILGSAVGSLAPGCVGLRQGVGDSAAEALWDRLPATLSDHDLELRLEVERLQAG